MELLAGAQAKAAADGVLAWPKLFGSGFAENDGGLRLAGLRLKAAAEEQRNAESLEVVCLDVGVVESCPGIVGRGFFSIERDGGCSKAIAAGWASGGDGGHSRQCGEAAAKLTDEDSLRSAVYFAPSGNWRSRSTTCLLS